MKHLIHLSLCSLALLLFYSCTQDEPIAPAIRTVQFTFALNENHATELPAGCTALLTITTPSGSPVLTDHEVGIKEVDNTFITEPLQLTSGEYLLSEFMVVYEDAAVFVTPKAASEFSRQVSKPLSYELSLRENRVVPLEVLDAKNKTAEKFGYRTLKVQKSAQWKIMVFTRENGVLTRSRAWHYLRVPGIAYGGELQAQLNIVPFSGDPQLTYELIVEKAGYVTYSTDFVYNDIKGKGNKPFKVILDRVPNENKFTITPPMSPGGDFTFELGLVGTGSLTVDWADGTVETINFAPDPASPEPNTSYVTASHIYEASTVPPLGAQISVTGDLDQIFFLETISVYATDIDTRNLTGLKEVTLYGLPINGLLDLSSNSELQSVTLEGTYAWEIRLPESHNISEVRLSDLDGALSQAVVDMFIENIYNNAIANDIRDGTFTILRPFSLSATSAQRLQQLVEDYGWQVNDGE